MPSLRLYNTYSSGVAYSDKDAKTYFPPDRATVTIRKSDKANHRGDAQEAEMTKSWIESESERDDSEVEAEPNSKAV